MRVLEPGHIFLLDTYDNDTGEPAGETLIFMKREGPGYPGNVGHHPGTNLQENWRADIARIQYLDDQVPCDENDDVIEHLRECIWLLEKRAARRHGRTLPRDPKYDNQFGCRPMEIELLPTCLKCGHIHDGDC